MTELDVPDYATMRRTLERLQEADVPVGIQCPRPECGGVLRRENDALVCGDCRRDAQLG